MESNIATTGWGTWSLPTKLTVGIGLFLATVLVVVLYLPR